MKKNAVAKSTPVETFHSNTNEDEFTVHTVQDTEPILDENKRAFNDYGDLLTPGKSGEGLRVASIPLTVWTQWMRETNGDIQKDPELMKKYLNDPDNKYFRTTPTRV